MDFSDTSFEQMPLAAKRRIDAVCERFERVWARRTEKASETEGPQLESFCQLVPEEEQAVLFGELLHVEIEHRRRHGEAPRAEDYLGRFPAREAVIRTVFAGPMSYDTDRP